LAAAVLTACTSWIAGPPPIPFTLVDSAEYEQYRGPGALELWGQAFLTTRSGLVRGSRRGGG